MPPPASASPSVAGSPPARRPRTCCATRISQCTGPRGAARRATPSSRRGWTAKALQRLELETELRVAISRDGMEVYYQPKVSIESGHVVGFEALMRWRHPERGLILPGEFVPVAEETGLIVQIGEQVLREACRQTKEWQDAHPFAPPIAVCVNLSARQFHDPQLVEKIRATLTEAGLGPESLVLEITESALMEDAPSTLAALLWLKGLGVKLAMDDFGTGYSSLSYLERFPVDYVKIDRSFVGGMDEEPGAGVLARGVIDLSHALGLKVVAEGVETEGQFGLLREMGCDFAQGYHFSGPLDAEAAAALITSPIPHRWALR